MHNLLCQPKIYYRRFINVYNTAYFHTKNVPAAIRSNPISVYKIWRHDDP